jgi:hypothetical protein
MKLIDKSALVAEIERLKERLIAFHHRDLNDWPLDNYGKMRAYNEVLSFIDTLEVKDVDLEKELRDFVVGDIDDYDMGLAKHFFELGLKAAQKGENV